MRLTIDITEKELKGNQDIAKAIETLLFSGQITQSETPKRPRFKPPTFEQIDAYVKEKNYAVDAQKFYTYYEDRQWMSNGRLVRDWKSCVDGWDRRAYSRLSGGQFAAQKAWLDSGGLL